MALDLPFATLAQLKARLGWTSTDEDSLLSEFLLAASGAIESEIGRPVRRVHARAEIFTGGRNTLRVRVDPIAKIHHIRESEDRDFDDSTKYDELVEGTDYLLDPGDGRIAGETGVIRRIDAKWMGNRNAPGQVKILYSGGYKTDEEEDLENKTVTISSASDISNYKLQNPGDDVVTLVGATSTQLDSVNNGTGDVQNWVYTIIQIKNSILATWKILAVTHSITSVTLTGGPVAVAYMIDTDDVNVNIDALLTIHSAALAGELIGTITLDSLTTLNAYDTTVKRTAFDKAVLLGTVAFAYIETNEGGESFGIETVNHATSGSRPNLIVTHKPSFIDTFKVPYDLRHACLMQASHEYQSRGSLGTIAASQRGVSIASGASIRGTQIDLLPEVIRLCAHYKRMF